MAMTGTEHLWSTPKRPLACTAGGYLIAATYSSTTGVGKLAITHLASGTTRVVDTIVDGLFASSCSDLIDGQIYVQMRNGTYGNTFAVVDVVAPSYTRLGGYPPGTTIGQSVCSIGSDLVLGSSRYRISTDTLDSPFGAAASSSIGTDGSRFFFAATGGSGAITECNQNTGATINSWATPGSALAIDSSRGALIGSRLYWPSSSRPEVLAVGFDLSTNATFVISSTPPGLPGGNRAEWTAHGGYLYRVCNGESAAKMCIADPNTGQWAVENLPTSRAERVNVVSANGKLWVASGNPTTW